MKYTREELDYIKKLCVNLEARGLIIKHKSACKSAYSKSQAMLRDGAKAYDERSKLKAEYLFTDDEKKSLLFYYPSDDVSLSLKLR